MTAINDTNYEECNVPEYSLPSLLEAGELKIKTAMDWNKRGRNYWLDLMEKEIYGKVPPRPDSIRFELLSEKKTHDGRALRRLVRVISTMNNGRSHQFDILFYMPIDTPVKAVLVGLNFNGNQTVVPDKDIPLPTVWMRPRADIGILETRATEESRNGLSGRWQVDLLLERGYGLATACYHEIYPDNNKGAPESMYRLFVDEKQLEKSPKEYPAISAWSWALSRMADYVETVPEAGNRIAVVGHSRLGKASLWAGANDMRFKLVISNNSGCGGAALFRRQFGEQVKHFIKHDLNWFIPGFLKYADKEETMPLDQHALLALIAPRNLYHADASEDLWADPKGSFLAIKACEDVYRLFGSDGLKLATFPGVGEVSIGDCSYHVRSGGHDIKQYDWENYLTCADGVFL